MAPTQPEPEAEVHPAEWGRHARGAAGVAAVDSPDDRDPGLPGAWQAARAPAGPAADQTIAVARTPSPVRPVASVQDDAARGLGFTNSAFAAPSLPRTAEVGPPASTNDVREFIREAAAARGIDPDVAVRVALSEGGLTPVTWTGDHGSSFGPFQLHYGGRAGGGNAVSGLGDAFTRETGLRADDPRTWRQQVEWSLDRAARGGWTPWHGAASIGLKPFDGIGQRPTSATVLLPQTGQTAQLGHPGNGHVEVPNQFAVHLSTAEAYAACGPVAAVAVARWLGRNPTVTEAMDTARRTGWTTAGGMNGVANEKRLLDAMHVSAQLEMPVNWGHIQSAASAGTPVILSTPKHYFVIDDFNPATGQYHVGQSGLAMRGGSDWLTAGQIQQLGGPPNGALYIDHPLADHPTMAPAIDLVDEPAPPPRVLADSDLRAERWWESERV